MRHLWHFISLVLSFMLKYTLKWCKISRESYSFKKSNEWQTTRKGENFHSKTLYYEEYQKEVESWHKDLFKSKTYKS